MIEPTEADIGRKVIYTGNRYPGGKAEIGVIADIGSSFVFVRYGADAHAKATSREDLEWENMLDPKKFMMGKPFHDRTALETLMGGEMEAMSKLLESAVFMDGFARGADMRFAAIEARLKALEEAHATAPGGAGFGRVVSPTPRQADIEQLPQDRDAAGSAVEASDQVPLSASGRTAPARDDG